MTDPLSESAQQLASALRSHGWRIVMAESCTAGLASAVLAGVPGISEHHCGSAVTYREDTKHCWLGVRLEDLEKHTAVSDVVARQMCVGVLAQTPEAHVGVSITGHLGPNAPDGFDGLVFVGSTIRGAAGLPDQVQVERVELTTSTRGERQQEAAVRLLRHALNRLASA
ncbi:MAG: CinA family protein [Planctomycetales bacterium]|nr:CinA family protein [Planctomycetales bacterium]